MHITHIKLWRQDGWQSSIPIYNTHINHNVQIAISELSKVPISTHVTSRVYARKFCSYARKFARFCGSVVLTLVCIQKQYIPATHPAVPHRYNHCECVRLCAVWITSRISVICSKFTYSDQIGDILCGTPWSHILVSDVVGPEKYIVIQNIIYQYFTFFQVSESKKLHAAINWIRHDPANRKEFIYRLLGDLDLSRLPLSHRRHLIENDVSYLPWYFEFPKLTTDILIDMLTAI